MRNGPTKGLEYVWLFDEIAILEDSARKHHNHNSQAWRTRLGDIEKWMDEHGSLLNTKQRSQARARLGRLKWSRP
jgi:hypothetical protein